MADHKPSHAGSPEYVAFLLMEKISDQEKMKRILERQDMLDLYAECLLAAYSKRTPRPQS